MSIKRLLRLFPQPCAEYELNNLYLGQHGWYQASPEEPAVTANFVSSLDGRIAIASHTGSGMHLPDSLTSKEDFRLFLELHAQADCLVTHGAYLRNLAAGRLGNILQLPDDPGFGDLYEWRRQHGLAPHPDIVIASSSLDFPLHPSLKESGQKIYIATGQGTDRGLYDSWQQLGLEVLRVGQSVQVEGRPLVAELAQRGYRNIYLIAGPKMLHTMVRDRQLHRLYLSVSHQLLGSRNFKTLLDGEELSHCSLRLNSLFFDESSDNGCGQFFTSFDCVYDE
ncbi:MAG: dihydrofolate reductase family protein [Gammaproteobacteria bacterium]|nr:dihydrofolate reductase family protein [Gammaproteobacteria bacterium]